MKFYSIMQMTLKLLLCFCYRSIRNYNLTMIKRKEIKLYLGFIGKESHNWKMKEDRLCN